VTGLICVPHGHITNQWQAEFLLVGRGSITDFTRSNATVYTIYNLYRSFFFDCLDDILSLSFKTNLP